jgi:hypothetical protein
VGSGCQSSKHQDQSSPTEHSQIIPWIRSEVYFYKEEGSTAAFERFRNTLHQVHISTLFFVCFWRSSPQWARASSFTMFLDHTQRRTTVGRTPLDEWSARRRDLHLTTQNTHNRQTSIHALGGIRTHNLSRRATADLRLRPRGHWDRPSTLLRWRNQEGWDGRDVLQACYKTATDSSLESETWQQIPLRRPTNIWRLALGNFIFLICIQMFDTLLPRGLAGLPKKVLLDVLKLANPWGIFRGPANPLMGTIHAKSTCMRYRYLCSCSLLIIFYYTFKGFYSVFILLFYFEVIFLTEAENTHISLYLYLYLYLYIFSCGATVKLGSRPPHFWGSWTTHAQ